MTVNKESLQAKLDAAVEEFESVEAKLAEAKEFVETAETALEQCRGKVTAYNELVKELDSENGQVVEEPEVVVGEVVDATEPTI